MSRFIETILISKGVAKNLPFHQLRINRTIRRFFNTHPFDLEKELLAHPVQGLFRCRLTYAKHIESVEFIPYERIKKTKLLAVESDLNYNYKFCDRSGLEQLSQSAQNSGCEDALIIKNGRITDTTIANIAFFDGAVWHTPARPLLRGTARERLLQSRLLKIEEIRPEHLERYSHFALMNALSGFYVAGGIDQIVL